MYKLNISMHQGMKASIEIDGEMAEKLGNRVRGIRKIHRDDLLLKFGYPKGLGSNFNAIHRIYDFLSGVLTESTATHFIPEIEAIPAEPKLNPIFNSIETLPEEGRQLILVFTDKEIMSGAMYCKEHDEFHHPKGDLKKHLIHQWAYADEFYAQLKLPEFPKEQPKRQGLDETIPQLFKLLFAAAAMAEKESEQEKKGFRFH